MDSDLQEVSRVFRGYMVGTARHLTSGVRGTIPLEQSHAVSRDVTTLVVGVRVAVMVFASCRCRRPDDTDGGSSHHG